MSMLAMHAAALNGPSTIYHEFLLRYKPNQAIVYGLVEGKEDPMFYRGLIEQSLPSGWHVELIPAGNRDAVLNSMNGFDWVKYKKNQICFFVDRDLTEFVGRKVTGLDNLYVTDNYSIENECVKFGVLDRVLKEALNLPNLKPHDVARVKGVFDTNVSEFQRALGPVMAQIIIWQRQGDNPCLSDISVNDFFSFTNGEIQIQPQFELDDARVLHAAACVGLSASPTVERKAVEAEFLLKDGLHKFIRGKYWFWFFVECALDIQKNIHRFSSEYSAAPKIKVSIGPKNAMIFVGPRVRCPDSLRNFVARNYGEFITPGSSKIRREESILSRFWSKLSSYFNQYFSRGAI